MFFQIQLAYGGVPMHVPFPYFYQPNGGGSKSHHFSSTMNDNEMKANARRGTTSPENSSSPINFSSTIQNATFNNHLSKYVENFRMENTRRPRSVSNEEKTRDQPDDDNIEVD